MPQKRQTVLKIFAVLICSVLIFAIGLVAWLTVTEFTPDEVITLNVGKTDKISAAKGEEKIETGNKIKVLTFNIGYANLGEESDFFMDGGKNVRNGDKSLVQKNLVGVKAEIISAKADVVFLQEVDKSAKRSFNINEYENIAGSFDDYYAYAENYVCDFVPFPFPPIGKVNSGIMTLTDFGMNTAKRISLPCPFSWPVSAANLKRCLLVSYHDVENSEKDLVLINLHLEAYDDGEGKIAQTKMLWEVLESEYAKGNYVIAGGDFNQTFPGSIEKYPILTPELWSPGVLEESALLEGWQYVYDISNPTCRLLDKPYDAETSQVYVIDGFIISPNVELVSAETIDCNFEYSDHNPVMMEIILR